MSVSSRRPLALIAITLLLLAACGGSSSGGTDHSLIGKTAPVIQGQSVTTGGSVDTSQSNGKPTVVVFWMNTCPHCQAFIPELVKAWPGVADKANVVTVGMQNPSVEGGAGYETTDAFIRTTGLTLPTVIGDLDADTKAWDFDAVPMAFIIGPDNVVTKAIKSPTAADLVKAATGG